MALAIYNTKPPENTETPTTLYQTIPFDFCQPYDGASQIVLARLHVQFLAVSFPVSFFRPSLERTRLARLHVQVLAVSFPVSFFRPSLGRTRLAPMHTQAQVMSNLLIATGSYYPSGNPPSFASFFQPPLGRTRLGPLHTQARVVSDLLTATGSFCPSGNPPSFASSEEVRNSKEAYYTVILT